MLAAYFCVCQYRLMQRHWICLVLLVCGCAGCGSSREAAASETIVGAWNVSGEFAPITQVFDKDGTFRSESDVEIVIKSGQKLVARFIFSGTYRESGHHLVTTITSFDVANVPEPDKSDIVKNGAENLQRTYRGKVEWTSPTRFLVHQENGRTLLYNRAD
jgi:hypothetical protein